jgi:hypothetical protein
MSEEKWLDIPEYEGIYQISDQGRIRSLDRMVRQRFGGLQHRKGQIISPWVNPEGYSFVMLNKETSFRRWRVHRLVLTVFMGPPEPGMECCHRDSNPRNNRIENLRWGTSASNSKDMIANGTSMKGERSNLSKLRNEQIAKIKEMLATGMTQQRIASLFNVKQTTISKIKLGCTWSHVQ